MKGKLVIALYNMWTKDESESRYKRESSEWQATYYDNYNCLIWIFHIYVHGLIYSVNPLATADQISNVLLFRSYNYNWCLRRSKVKRVYIDNDFNISDVFVWNMLHDLFWEIFKPGLMIMR